MSYKHDYPFCWRCDSPLLYYAMESWFIAMTKVQESLVKNNNQYQLVPGASSTRTFWGFYT